MTTKQLINIIRDANFDDIIRDYRESVKINNATIHLGHFKDDRYTIDLIRNFERGFTNAEIRFTVINNTCVLTGISFTNTHTYFEDSISKNIMNPNLKSLFDTMEHEIEVKGYAIDDDITKDYLEILTETEIDFFFDYIDKFYDLTPVSRKSSTAFKITSDFPF